VPSFLGLFTQQNGFGVFVYQRQLSPSPSTTTTITTTTDLCRFQSTNTFNDELPEPIHTFDELGETSASSSLRGGIEGGTAEMISFPMTNPKSSTLSPAKIEYQPILLNSKEHAVGYLSKILNARVYEAAIETELQHAKNLSAVSRVPSSATATLELVVLGFDDWNNLSKCICSWLCWCTCFVLSLS
jgi:hypothetical protein